ncbi:MAG TPA: hypothetical protein VFM12_00490 [Gemmatimonadales bacterium]|nr:hypothetical protein [Gemmatimonadales bacterium]
MQALSDSYEFDGWDVNVPAKHPLYQFGRRRERAREFVFTRKDDAIFEAALREKFPDILIFLRAPGYVLTFERVQDLYADNRRGERWLILPREGRNWGPLVEVVSDPSSPKVQACLRNLPGRWLAYSRSSWQLVEGGLLNRRTAFDWPYLGIGALRGQVWDLDPDLENVKSFYRTVLRIVSRIATNQVKHGSRLMNEAYGSDYRSMADLKGGQSWMGHCALEWSRAGGDRKMLGGFYRPADDWEAPRDPWYIRLKAAVEAKYGVEFGLPPECWPDDTEFPTP